MIRSLYDWVIRLAAHPRAIPALGAFPFWESSVFPIPPDVMLIPMVLANRKKAFTIAAVCTVCSVLGGMLGYAIGYYFFETPGGWGVRPHHTENGRAPPPCVLFALCGASIGRRGARFFIVAALLWRFGEPIRTFVEKRLTLLTW